MVTLTELTVGHRYFLMSFYDNDFKIPKIRTVIYIGKNICQPEGSEDEWYFQDAESFLEYGSFEHMPKDIKRDVFTLDEDALSLVYDLDGLIRDLIEIREGRLGKYEPD